MSYLFPLLLFWQEWYTRSFWRVFFCEWCSDSEWLKWCLVINTFPVRISFFFHTNSHSCGCNCVLVFSWKTSTSRKAWSTSAAFSFQTFVQHKSSTKIPAYSLKPLAGLPSFSLFIVVPLQPLIHLKKTGGPSPHLLQPSFMPVLRLSRMCLISPLCLWNVKAEEQTCICSLWISHGMHHFQFTPAVDVACYDRRWLWSIYFSTGCGNSTCWYTTIVSLLLLKLWLMPVDAFSNN